MPLIDIHSGEPIKSVPYADDFKALRKSLTKGEFEAIEAEINKLIDAAGSPSVLASAKLAYNSASAPRSVGNA